jgi:hypothetical protein
MRCVQEYIYFHVNCLLLLCDCNQKWTVSTNLMNRPNMEFHENMLEWFSNHYMKMDGLTRREAADAF